MKSHTVHNTAVTPGLSHYYYVVLLLACVWVMTSDCWSQARKQHGTRHGAPKEARWADAAFEFFKAQNCLRASFMNRKECERLVQHPKESMAVHVASSSPYGRFQAILPDERMAPGHSHDVIIVLDLFPMASFGHLVVVLYLDIRLSRDSCHQQHGIYLDHGECLQLAVRRRCKNLMEFRYRKRNFAKRCEINFLPVVNLDTDNEPVKKNHLICRDDIPGFHACAELRPEEETSRGLCDQIRENSQECTTSRGTIRTSCKVFEVCDQAVIISGGWNRQTAGIVHAQNVADMYLLLRRNGYRRKHIKVFYANGVNDFEVGEESPITAHPSSSKMAFRYHLLRMCASPHCVDSLVLYVNSPTTHDGSILLWDTNGDGLADEGEKYTLKEILSDLHDCSARQVQEKTLALTTELELFLKQCVPNFGPIATYPIDVCLVCEEFSPILIDSSYAGELVHAIKQSSRHDNVIVMSSGKGYEYSHSREFTTYWSALTDIRTCTTDAHWKSHNAISKSSPMISNQGGVKKTLSGAPCNARPPFTNKELKRDFFGCQNLPTAVWLQRILKDSGEKLKPLHFT